MSLATLSSSACRTELLETAEPIADLPANGTYSARMLATNLERLVVFEQSEAADVCAWIIAATSRNSNFGFTAPLGWIVESGSINRFRADCFKLEPFSADFWSAEGTGALTYDGVDASALPCAVNVHGQILAYLSENMVMRPVGIAEKVRFDVDQLPVVGACGH